MRTTIIIAALLLLGCGYELKIEREPEPTSAADQMQWLFDSLWAEGERREDSVNFALDMRDAERNLELAKMGLPPLPERKPISTHSEGSR